MFFSKIWLFLLTLVAAISITVVLLLPRPAARVHALGEQQRLAVGCGVVNILLADNARRRLDFTRRFARHPELVAALYAASGTDQLDEKRMSSTREIGNRLLSSAKGSATRRSSAIWRRGGRSSTTRWPAWCATICGCSTTRSTWWRRRR